MKNMSKIVFIIGIIVLFISCALNVSASILYSSDEVSYDNTSSGLSATNAQTAVNELSTSLDSGISSLSSKVGSASLTTNATDISGAINELNTNTLLWNSSWYMNASQTVKINKTPSDLNRGLILVWSAYENGTAQNYNYNTCVIPKDMITSDYMHFCCFMSGAAFRAPAQKCLQVTYYQGQIQLIGESGNTTSGTKNGINYNNLLYVLRHVIEF